METLTVEILYFAALREHMASAGESPSLPRTVKTVADLRGFLEEHRSPLRGRLAAVRFAVGDEFVSDDHELHPGDVVALIPPVSGG